MIDPRDLAIICSVMAPWSEKISRVSVFGSRAVGTARANSDIDLVVFGDVHEDDIDRLWTLLDDSSLSVTVDLLAYSDTLSPPLKRQIERVARPVLSQRDLAMQRARTPVSLAAKTG